jgi:Fe-S oxidoreductase
LLDEWPELVPSKMAQQVASVAELAEAWIARQQLSGQWPLLFERRGGTAIVHGHCHQKALVGLQGTLAALRLIPGLNLTALDAGCCGMAGSFGMEKKHYEISQTIVELELAPAVRSAAPHAVIVATGTSCRHQIHEATGRTPLHPIALLANAAGLTSKPTNG